MASNINPLNIDITYPVAGQDNDTKGFRDNFSNIRNNFSIALTEISNLQSTLGSTPSIVTPPASYTDRGVAGQIAYNSNYLYVCVAANTWIRIAVTDTVF